MEQRNGFVFTAITVAVGLGLCWFHQRHRTGVVAEHLVDSAIDETTAPDDDIDPEAVPAG